MIKNFDGINMPLTLEQHFKFLSDRYFDVGELYSLWTLLRKDLEDRLPHSRGVFVHYSLHDATHSRSVIRAIERFLGDDRIKQLSATDTFMLLSCAYAHDYGMAMTFNQIYDALGTEDFADFLKKQQEVFHTLGEEDVKAIKNLLSYVQKKPITASLQELYFAIMSVIQTYLRPTHWKGVEHVWGDFRGLLEGRLNGRFIQGGEGIIEICEAHGKPFEDILKMSIRADGIVGDDFHPRFIAAMLRLGDLLDLDNGRFPQWFVTEIGRNQEVIPHLSVLHYKKHEAINHLLITPKRIEVCASCNGENGYETAELIREWVDWLEKECASQIQYWSEITPMDFGRPPKVSKVEILLEQKPYISENRKLQMRMSQDRVMKLLEGTSIYQDRYVGIRELVQNAVDASLLQLWYDITHNRYINLGISKHGHKIRNKDSSEETDKKEMGLLEHGCAEINGIFGNYAITVELIKDMIDKKVYVVIKDKGTGITQQDISHMSDIGTSKEKNERVVEIMKDMPRWMKPAGIFGIGLQSAFQLTDQIEFYTRRPNEPERLIVFHSYGRNHGKIEIQEVSSDLDGIYYDNAIPGTNVKIAINPRKLLPEPKEGEEQQKDLFIYYDMEFDTTDILHAIYVELSHVIEKRLRECPYDYFNIYYQTMTREKEGEEPSKGIKYRLRCSYFSPNKDNGKLDLTQKKLNENTIWSFYSKNTDVASSFYFSNNKAHYADEKNYRIYQLTVREGEVLTTADGERFQLPQPVRNLYHFQYKFNSISDAHSIYHSSVRHLRDVHAGFLYWNINILDDSPERYLNIDRDRLREGAVMEEELAQVREIILQQWCKELIKRYQKTEEDRKKEQDKALEKLKRENRQEEFKEKKPKNFYRDTPRTLVSLALLFYQNVPIEQFRKFISPYSEFLKEKKFMLKGENFYVDRLWEEGVTFRCCFTYPQKWLKSVEGEKEQNLSENTEIHIETISRLPHRLVHITEISLNDSGELNYYLKLGHPSTEPAAISMDYAARLYDYGKVIKVDSNRRKEVNFDSLIRKVFKPNQKYSNLLVSRYPKTFERGENFSSPLDHCIRWYILSAFDRDLTVWMQQIIFGKNSSTLVPLRRLKSDIDKYAAQSDQMEKCIQYVYKQHVERAEENAESLPENLKEKIRREYKEFLFDCCDVLIKQKDLIKNG